MFSGSPPCLLGQHGSCSSAQLPVELSENMLQNLFLNLPPQTVQEARITFILPLSEDVVDPLDELVQGIVHPAAAGRLHGRLSNQPAAGLSLEHHLV